MSDKRPSLFDLFFTFFRIGAFTFGGGIAMLPLLTKECVESKKWVSEDEILNYFAIGQCTPGIIAVNTATFVGYKTRGILGGIFATAGVILPGSLIILLLASVFKKFSSNEYLVKAFNGIRIAVVAVILNSIIDLAKKGLKTYSQAAVTIVSFILLELLGVSPVIIVCLTIILGVVSWRLKK